MRCLRVTSTPWESGFWRAGISTGATCAADAHVAIVNEEFARHFFGNQSAIGRRLGQGGGPKSKLDKEIIGVVSDSLYEGPREGVHRQVFIPNWGNGGVAFYVRTALSPASAYTAVKSEVKKLDAAMPVYELKTLGRQLDETLLTERLIALLSAGFGLLATSLATIGLYGVMAFVVARRPRSSECAWRWERARGGDLVGDAGSVASARDRFSGRCSIGHRLRSFCCVAAVCHQAERPMDCERYIVC